MTPCCARCRRGMPGMGGSCGQPACPCPQKAVCTCTPVSNLWTYYGIVEPGGALEPDMDCPVNFPTEAATRECHSAGHQRPTGAANPTVAAVVHQFGTPKPLDGGKSFTSSTVETATERRTQ